MARVIVSSEKINESLSRTSAALENAKTQMSNKHGDIELEVPDPYPHSLTRGPVDARGCTTLDDPCYDTGIMLGVFALIKPKANVKTKRRN